ncbi:polyprenyl synthetase family protein [Salinicoccus sp. ID82-1]|uniref:Farnesyl diphosphate synthase n=1 Tax=Salinicoccus cyprini TaxID=2493691 RepID=A0A558B028_9STAP|nr:MULTISPECIES: farnesyl diphosphate synthase [Salinicoccus]MCG1009041.1 polyprenyl synthetase family protein [Salinicoccus sp. ID82-1]TVT29879.1 polyprenyl synthetase family protein [Salinicoccus cyprini]
MNNNMQHYLEATESSILAHLGQNHVSPTIRKASSYSIEAGGKRFRPYLLFSTLDALGHDPMKGVQVAAAIEMIHTYSLIHDDLPAMDDDDYRRGKPTNHKVYGEAAAILAGDTLLTESFSIVAQDDTLPADKRVALIGHIAAKSGFNGMIGGQMLDIEAEGQDISLSQLENIHQYKTGQLIVLPVQCACIIADATDEVTAQLIRFAEALGILFQIRDDILDVEGDIAVTGKSSGSDEKNNKTTYVSTYGLSGAHDELEQLVESAKRILDDLAADIETEQLYSVLQRFAVRNQ